MAIIAAAVIGGGTVAFIGNAGKTPTKISSPSPTVQSSPTPRLPESTTSSTTKKPGCEIKGNISSSGEKIYHMPGQRFYEKTVISEGVGERWFCTEDEAIAAGWRKSKV